MNNKKKFLIVLLVFSFILVSSYVLAAEENLLESIFSPLKGIDIAEFYEDYSTLIDFAVYVILFTSLTKVAKPDHFKNRAGNSAMIVIGIILAISLSVFTKKIGFQLGNIGPFAFFVLLIFATVFIFRAFTKNSDISKRLAGSIAYMFVYLMIMMINKDFIEVIKGMHPLVYSMIQIGFVLSLVFIVMGIINFAKGGGTRAGTVGTTRDVRGSERGADSADDQSDRIEHSEQVIQERFDNWLKNFNDLREQEAIVHKLTNQLINTYNNAKGNFNEMKETALKLEVSLKEGMKSLIDELRSNRDVFNAERKMERLNRRLSSNYSRVHKYTEDLLKDLNKTIGIGQGKLNADRIAELVKYRSILDEKRKIIQELEKLQGAHIQSERGVAITFANEYRDLLKKIDDEIDKFIDVVNKIIGYLDKAESSKTESEIKSSLDSVQSNLQKIIDLFTNMHLNIRSCEDKLEKIIIENKQNMAIIEDMNNLEEKMNAIKTADIAVNLNSAKAIVYNRNIVH